MHGIILINKALSDSSFRVVKRVKGITKCKKVGHGGTLDPLATGMLPICLGEASKFSRFILDADKCYTVKAELGRVTTTGDSEGEIIASNYDYNLSSSDILKHIQKFRGEISQVPPSYSALKHNGKPLYEYAREGINIIKPPRLVTIKEFEIISWQKPVLECRVVCSKGTYIRSLLADLGSSLGVGGSLVALHRNWVEPFVDANMLSLEELSDLEDICSSDCYYTLGKMFSNLPRRDVTEHEALNICYGKEKTLEFDNNIIGNIALFYNSEFLGIAEAANNRELKVVRLCSSMVKKLTNC